jgi:glycosyltransferase involved in cell wall biosynthesis
VTVTSGSVEVELSIVVPVYREAKSIGLFLTRIRSVMDIGGIDNYEVIFAIDP